MTRCLLDPNGCINCKVTSRSASASHAVSSVSVLVRKGSTLSYSIVNSRDWVPKIAGFVIFYLPGFWISSRAWLIWPSHNANSLLNSERDQVTASVNKPLWRQLVAEAEQKHGSCHRGFVVWRRLMWFDAVWCGLLMTTNCCSCFLSSHGSEFNKRTLVAFVLAHLHYMYTRLMGLFIRSYLLS